MSLLDFYLCPDACVFIAFVVTFVLAHMTCSEVLDYSNNHVKKIFSCITAKPYQCLQVTFVSIGLRKAVW